MQNNILKKKVNHDLFLGHVVWPPFWISMNFHDFKNMLFWNASPPRNLTLGGWNLHWIFLRHFLTMLSRPIFKFQNSFCTASLKKCRIFNFLSFQRGITLELLTESVKWLLLHVRQLKVIMIIEKNIYVIADFNGVNVTFM